jgi:hypothetical protein
VPDKLAADQPIQFVAVRDCPTTHYSHQHASDGGTNVTIAGGSAPGPVAVSGARASAIGSQTTSGANSSAAGSQGFRTRAILGIVRKKLAGRASHRLLHASGKPVRSATASQRARTAADDRRSIFPNLSAAAICGGGMEANRMAETDGTCLDRAEAASRCKMLPRVDTDPALPWTWTSPALSVTKLLLRHRMSYGPLTRRTVGSPPRSSK